MLAANESDLKKRVAEPKPGSVAKGQRAVVGTVTRIQFDSKVKNAFQHKVVSGAKKDTIVKGNNLLDQGLYLEDGWIKCKCCPGATTSLKSIVAHCFNGDTAHAKQLVTFNASASKQTTLLGMSLSSPSDSSALKEIGARGSTLDAKTLANRAHIARMAARANLTTGALHAMKEDLEPMIGTSMGDTEELLNGGLRALRVKQKTDFVVDQASCYDE